MIVIDTSALVDALTWHGPSAEALQGLVERGERTALPAPVLYEWLRGPRRPDELARQEALWPAAAALPFGAAEAQLAAALYRKLRNPKGRAMDLAIAACAMVAGAELWTLNPADFRDIPGVVLANPP